ncbi:hypothetical protein AMECASPLE_020629 [Ameca splendens]|uniref:Uncharacterized protein n=1 Tax=Ameca splendens TaxID=208324 RepID=A0ABV0XSB3_9TELE
MCSTHCEAVYLQKSASPCRSYRSLLRSCYCQLFGCDSCQRFSKAKSATLGPPVSVSHRSLEVIKDHLKLVAVVFGKARESTTDILMPGEQKVQIYTPVSACLFPVTYFLPNKIHIPVTLWAVKVAQRHYKAKNIVLRSSVFAFFLYTSSRFAKYMLHLATSNYLQAFQDC